MSPPRFEPSPELVIKAYNLSHNWRSLCRGLGLCPTSDTTARRVCEAHNLLLPAKHWSVQPQAPDLSGLAAEPQQAVTEDKALIRAQTELRELKRKYDTACKHANLHEDVLEIAREVMSREAPCVVQAPHIGLSHIVEDAILAWTDWHVDEVVSLKVMQGYNEYNPGIACRRAQYTVDHTLSILFDIHRGSTFEHLWVVDHGDNLTGGLLDDNKITNSMTFLAACRFAAKIKARALNELSAHIPVTYVGVPGNHPRMSEKMQWKLPTENGDWLIAQMVGDLCRDNERITVVSPEAWTVVINVRGWNHSINHGYSAAKGGYGGIPWYSYQRTDGKLTALESAHGQRVHYRWYGHVHQKAELPMMDGEGDQFIVGSLMGGNEYALGSLSSYANPVQKIVGVHEKTGVSWRYPLDVKFADGEPGRYEDLCY